MKFVLNSSIKIGKKCLFNRPETSFYRFPGVTANTEQYDLWLKAIDRVKEDGSPWVPQPKRSLVCSDHFVSGKPSSDSTDKDYAPSVFETAARKEGRKSESKLKCELEEYDPDDPEFDPFVEPPPERRGGKRIKNVSKDKLEATTEKQPDVGVGVIVKGEPGEAKARPEPAFPKAIVRVAGSDREFPNKAPSGNLNLSAGDLKRLIEDHDPAVDTVHWQRKRSRDEWNFRQYMKYVRYEKKIVHYWYCRLCRLVVEEPGLKGHECITALADVTHIRKTEPSRVTVLEGELVDGSHLFVYAVLLDGDLADYGFCSKCESFIPKAVMVREDFSHKCSYERKGLYSGAKFTSPNLRSVPATEVGPRSHRVKGRNYECLLCGERCASMYFAEIHMRQVHGEGGGKEVLCTYCGEGFTTSTRARQHEVKVHLEDNLRGTVFTHLDWKYALDPFDNSML